MSRVLTGLLGHGKLATELGLALTGKVGGLSAARAVADDPPVRTRMVSTNPMRRATAGSLSGAGEGDPDPTKMIGSFVKAA